MTEQCQIDIRPQESLADGPMTAATVRGLAPGTKIILRARTRDEAGVDWASWGTFLSDQTGAIDVSKQAPSPGTFAVPDPSALLWSMRPAGDVDRPVPLFEKNTAAPLEIEVSAEADGTTLSRTTIRRIFSLPEGRVVREPIDRGGVTGALFLPAGKGPYPAIICLSGSGGGFSEPRAALLAARGYAALALGYFNAGSLPKELQEIPVEFLERGIGWLEKHPSVDCSRLAVYGFSKGGELALLLGSLYPRIKAVAAVSGSSYVWQGLNFRRPSSSWARGGKEIPFLRMKVPLATMFKLLRGKTVAFRESYERGLRAAGGGGEAAIRVEKINGPVFLVAGTDDQVWPASDFADMIAEQLKKQGNRHPVEYLREEGAGHLVGLPYFPAAQVCRNLIFTSSAVDKSSLALIKAWDAMIVFLGKYL